MKFSEKELLEYACRKFDERNYGEALEAFVLAYGKGIEQDWILENIYSCYMDGNDIQFRETYKKQEDRLNCGYEECTLDFVPCRESEYYVFDKEKKLFVGKFLVSELRDAQPDSSFAGMEFSGAALDMDGNWGEYKNILAEAKNREIYAVCHDLKRAASFCKIPELEEYMEHVRMFTDMAEFQEYFHKYTAVYMPWIVVGNEDAVKELNRILKEEHRYRLTSEGRNTENILLTIGIPTHDRGNLLLERLENLRKMPYDAEIEIAISKNGTYYYQEEYESVEKIEDARINYVGYNAELGMSKNWQNVIKIAHGKFVLLVSDEDDVILSALEHYLKFLSVHGDFGIVSARTELQKSMITKDLYYKKGRDAFLGGFCIDNYLSGLIYNRQLFLEADIAYWDRGYQNNNFYRLYPHLWWHVLIAFKGDYARDCKTLILEGECILAEETEKYRRDNATEAGLADGGMDWEYPDLPIPSTYESRLEQFHGAVELIKDYFDKSESLKIDAWDRLLNKTLYLMELVYEAFQYKTEEYPGWIERTLIEAVFALERLGVDKGVQKCLVESMLNYTKAMADRSS